MNPPKWFKLSSLQIIDLSRFTTVDLLGVTVILREGSPSGINIRKTCSSPQAATDLFNKICKKLTETEDDSNN